MLQTSCEEFVNLHFVADEVFVCVYLNWEIFDMRSITMASAVFTAILLAGSANADELELVYNLENWGLDAGNIISDDIDFGVGVASINSITVTLSHSWAADVELGLYAPTDDQSDTADLAGTHMY